MNKAVHMLLAGCVLGAVVFQPFSTSLQLGSAVQAAPALAFVTGTVKDVSGAPLAGAVVSLLEPQIRGKEIKTLTTDAQGRFSTGMPPGAYRIRALAEGFLPILSPRLIVERPSLVYNFALKRTDTLIEKRGDSDNYRWVGLSVPRHVLNFDESFGETGVASNTTVTVTPNSFNNKNRPQIHGMVQLLAVNGSLGDRKSVV